MSTKVSLFGVLATAALFSALRVIYPALALLTMLVPSLAIAEPNKEQYKLQERCGKQAEEEFKKEYESRTDTRPCGQTDYRRPPICASSKREPAAAIKESQSTLGFA
jgi:hypothetical protein